MKRFRQAISASTIAAAILAAGLGACARASSAETGTAAHAASSAPAADPRATKALDALAKAGVEIGAVATAAIRERIAANPEGFLDLLDRIIAERNLDPGRFRRVDKVAPSLGATFVPPDLVGLEGIIPVAKPGLELRKGAAEALSAMVKAAKAEGVTLVGGSAYRSWKYQEGVFAREVKLYGEETARRESAEAGRSQHQLGTAIDFSPIDDAFATTSAFAWLSQRAREFGFSRSYPEGFEAITGYRPESWHWRWLGRAATSLEAGYFGGVQQYVIEFLAEF